MSSSAPVDRRRMRQTSEPEAADFRWQGLYRLGGAATLPIAVLLLGEVAVYAALPSPRTAADHFALFHDNWLAGLLTLDLLGIVAYLLFVPTILALYAALHRSGEAAMAVATVLFFLGVADFLATNTAFPALVLSDQYAAATTDEDRALALAAGQAMFALFNENAFLVSYVLVSAAWMLIAAVMLRSAVFSRITACAGILAGGSGIVAVALEHIAGGGRLRAVAIAVYFAAIVFLFIWVVLTGRRLYRLGGPNAVAEP